MISYRIPHRHKTGTEMLETKYIELSEKIAEGIRNGLWQERLPGVIKLSKELKADPATISKAFKVLADKGLVTINGKKGTYITQPGQKAKHKVIGIIGIQKDNTQLHSDEFSEIEKSAEKNGYRVIGIAHSNKLFADDMNLLLQFPVDGYIFMYSSLTFEIAAFLKQKGVKFVAANKPVGISGVNWVDFDSEAAFRGGMEYLIKQGHKKIAYIEFHNPNYMYSARMLSVYKDICAENELAFNESFFVSRDVKPYYKLYGEEYEQAYGFECANDLVKESNIPTAVMITGTKKGIGLRQGLKKHNLIVPDDISVLTYGEKNKNDEFFSNVELNYKHRASTAGEMLLELINNPLMDIKQELITYEIIIRKSTSNIKVTR